MNPFERLAPFIKEFIWQQGWTELRQMQGDAVQAILDTDHHILLAGATASGKTEAAFLPMLTDLHARPSSSVGILYLGPLKALINDQFQRLDLLLEHAGIPVWPWHGDVGQGVKNRALKTHQGVMQTTPESLEGFFLYRSQYLPTLFADLRYVVIDEVHAFMASDRGRQILCQLARLERSLNIKPRRVGLSATLGDYSLAEAWLSAGSGQRVTTLDDRDTKRRIKLALTHYQLKEGEDGSENDYLAHLFDLTQKRKNLIFVNRRADAEEVGGGLRDLAQRTGKPDIYFVHHGSVSKDYRLAAEEAMRAANQPTCTVATVTLELGIDLGQLERVLQIGPGPSVSSFVQRLGRTGRRGEPGEMIFFSLEEAPDPTDSPIDQLPWVLLLTIAQIQLYLEERWVEPIPAPRYPLSLLYHQTMSTLMQAGDLAPAELAQRILTLPPFGHIEQEAFKAFLRHLLETEHLQWTERKRLLIGLAGERVVNDWRFLATFQDTEDYQVTSGSEHIGSLSLAPLVDTVIRLAGRTWLVTDVDEKQRVVVVKPTKGKAKTSWMGIGGGIHDRVVQRLRRVLEETTAYGYLLDNAKQRLMEAREVVRHSGLLTSDVHERSDGTTLLLPWLGSKAYLTLLLMLKLRLGESNVSGSGGPYLLMVKMTRERLLSNLKPSVTLSELEEHLPPTAVPHEGKFDQFVPSELLRRAFVSDDLDIEQATAFIERLTASPISH